MKRAKVTLIHNTIAPYRHPLFEGLSRFVDLTVYYCSVKHEKQKWELWPKEYDYKYKVLPNISINFYDHGLNFNPSIFKELIVSKPDVLVLGGYIDPTIQLAFLIGKIMKIPIIYWTEGVKGPRSTSGILLRPLRSLFVKASSAIIVPGRLSQEWILWMGAEKEKFFLAPNAIDNKLFIDLSNRYKLKRKEIRNQLKLEDNVIILYVGQLIERKGIEHLLYAHKILEKEHNNAVLLLVGNGNLESHIKNLVNSENLDNVKFIQSGLTLEELTKIYSIADIFVLPTLKDIWGFVINEAMACGLPVISTYASQAAIEMIHNKENGFIVREANSYELYQSLKYLVTHPEHRINMGKRSREIITHEFNVQNMVDGFLKAIKYCTNS